MNWAGNLRLALVFDPVLVAREPYLFRRPACTVPLEPPWLVHAIARKPCWIIRSGALSKARGADGRPRDRTRARTPVRPRIRGAQDGERARQCGDGLLDGNLADREGAGRTGSSSSRGLAGKHER